ncbi:MAG: FliI/YscN family ATPase [Longimicrobiales bacterium]
MPELLMERVRDVPRFVVCGRVQRVAGLVIEATGVDAAVGDICRIRTIDGSSGVDGEVVGFNGGRVLIMPYGGLGGLQPGSAVEVLGRAGTVGVGDELLGRVIDARGDPIDGKGPIRTERKRPLAVTPMNPLRRRSIDTPLPTGVRAIDGALTVGRGQRIGIFSGSGVGKSTLLGMIARGTSADLNVIALVGERGREVPDFLDHALGPEGLSRSVVVVATGDESALLRARAAWMATLIAEDYRERGMDVLLMVDSITRVATAWREIGLAAGEPPTTKGYPPSVFALLPRLLERAGTDETGTITGVYTVLVEGDDFNEPVADAARSILDGHVVLTRELATAGHFPAVDVLRSVSRLRERVLPESLHAAARDIQRLVSAYREKEDLIAVGAYREGTDRQVDLAIRMREPIAQFLRQAPNDLSDWSATTAALAGLKKTSLEIMESLA